jgi:hypothetical protein
MNAFLGAKSDRHRWMKPPAHGIGCVTKWKREICMNEKKL